MAIDPIVGHDEATTADRVVAVSRVARRLGPKVGDAHLMVLVRHQVVRSVVAKRVSSRGDRPTAGAGQPFQRDQTNATNNRRPN